MSIQYDNTAGRRSVGRLDRRGLRGIAGAGSLEAKGHRGAPEPRPYPQAASRKPSVWAWWLAGALIMGSAAAWWVYESQQQAADTESLDPVVEQIPPLETPDERQPKATQPAARLNPIDATTETQEDAAAQQRRLMIYRREAY